MNIAELLHEQAQKRPDAPAIIDRNKGRDRVTTFSELEAASAQGAALLLKNGLAPGDTVLVFQPMSAELYIALLSLFRSGMIAMFLDASVGKEHIERCCAIRPPAGLIASPKAHLLRLFSPALRRIPHRFTFGRFIPGATVWSRSRQIAPHGRIASCNDDTPALITFTSGSTGLPKAAVRTHRFLLEQQRVLQPAIRLREGVVDLTTMPVFVLANLASGVTSLIPDADLRRPGAIAPEPVLYQINRLHPERTVASPAFLERIATASRESGRTVPGFNHIFTGGAPVFPDHLERFAEAFPGADIVAVYGSTEAEPIAHISWKELTVEDMQAMARGGGLLAGFPVSDIRVAILSATWGTPLGRLSVAEFDKRCLPSGKTGEIVVTGDHVLKGYLNGAGDEETKFRVNGMVWHRTGDCGYFDDKDRLWLLGRASAVIHDRNGVLYPFAVESAARQVPGVAQAALLGSYGERILFVQPRVNRKLDIDAVREKLSWARLDKVHPIPNIPMDRRHNAKVDYGRLGDIARRLRGHC